MSTHNTEVVAWKRLSNGQHAACIRCCGDQGTDHWHTMNVMTPEGKPVDPAVRDQNLAAVHKFVGDQHEQMRQHTQAILDLAGKLNPVEPQGQP